MILSIIESTRLNLAVSIIIGQAAFLWHGKHNEVKACQHLDLVLILKKIACLQVSDDAFIKLMVELSAVSTDDSF